MDKQTDEAVRGRSLHYIPSADEPSQFKTPRDDDNRADNRESRMQEEISGSFNSLKSKILTGMNMLKILQ